uniref:Uncharacterized protein n=1 Tax=Arundo donax TaxID=35708 RepID=A0A0A9CH03_ARUDO
MKTLANSYLKAGSLISFNSNSCNFFTTFLSSNLSVLINASNRSRHSRILRDTKLRRLSLRVQNSRSMLATEVVNSSAILLPPSPFARGGSTRHILSFQKCKSTSSTGPTELASSSGRGLICSAPLCFEQNPSRFQAVASPQSQHPPPVYMME